MNWTKEQITALVKKYPFLYPVNVWTGERVQDYDFSCYRGDKYELPQGWSKLFLLMCKHLLPVIQSTPHADKFYFTELKEKYGTMRVYTSYTTDEISKILDIYESYSRYICSICGEKATKETYGWVSFICDNCAKEESRCYSVRHKSCYSADVFVNGEWSRVVYSYRPLKSEYYAVKDLTDDEFFNYIME